MLSHPRDMARAEITKTLILRLRFMVDHGAQKGVVLHHGIVDLTAQKIDSALHRVTHSKSVDESGAQHAPSASGESQLLGEDATSKLEELGWERDASLDRDVLERG